MSQVGSPPLPPTGTVRFQAIGDAWKIISSDFGTWIIGSLILLGGTAVVFLPAYFWMVFSAVGTAMLSDQQGRHTNTLPAAFFVQLVVVWLVAFVLLAAGTGLWIAAMMRLGLRRARGLAAGFNDFFNLEGQWLRVAGFNLLLPFLMLPVLVIVFAVFGLLAAISFKAAPALSFVFVGFGYVIALVGSFVLQSLLELAPLLIVDRKLSISDAMLGSIKALWPHVLPACGVSFCAAFLSALGELACGIGIIVTMPIKYVTLSVIYNDLFPEAVSEVRIPEPMG